MTARDCPAFGLPCWRSFQDKLNDVEMLIAPVMIANVFVIAGWSF